jgi:hypothetical protein
MPGMDGRNWEKRDDARIKGWILHEGTFALHGWKPNSLSESLPSKARTGSHHVQEEHGGIAIGLEQTGSLPARMFLFLTEALLELPIPSHHAKMLEPNFNSCPTRGPGNGLTPEPLRTEHRTIGWATAGR